MEQKELDKIIKLHEEWIVGNCDGKYVDFSNTDLSNTNLNGVNLNYINFNNANLANANLSNTNLGFANLIDTDLSNTDLSGANLSYASLIGANLSGANLVNSILSYANLSDAVLDNANLSGATLNWVNWHEAKGLKVYEAQLNSSRENAQLVYIPSLDLVTTGCWHNTWKATKKRVEDVYKEYNTKIYRKYQLAFLYIENQRAEDIGG